MTALSVCKAEARMTTVKNAREPTLIPRSQRSALLLGGGE